MPVYPIIFSIPKNKITEIHNCIEKTQFTSSLIPGDIKTYIYNTEKEYYENYQKSFFAITTKKAGWDCLRHYEILANCCIPYFINIEECPIDTLSLFPKEIILESNNFYKKMIEKYSEPKLTDNEKEEYNILLNRLMLYTNEKLTTTSIVKYILNKINYESASKILFLNGCQRGDYLRCLTLHGFKTIFGKNCHEYPIVPHLYNDIDIHSTTCGLGFTYTHILNSDVRNDLCENQIIEYIKSKYYDIVVYGSYHRGMPFFNMVLESYSNDKIILLCGEDIHDCNYETYSNMGIHVFVREL
jgi:hypothetical protein